MFKINFKHISYLKKIPTADLWKEVDAAIKNILKEDYINSEVSSDRLISYTNNSLIKSWEVKVVRITNTIKIQSNINLNSKWVYYILVLNLVAIVLQFLLGLPILMSIFLTFAVIFTLIGLLYFLAVKPILKAIVKKTFSEIEEEI